MGTSKHRRSKQIFLCGLYAASFCFAPSLVQITRAAQIVCLTREDAQSSEAHSPLLVRELFRQGVLLAARDELGLATRDQVLREPFPTGDGLFDLQWEVTRPAFHITILRTGKKLWHGDIPWLPGGRPWRIYEVAAQAAERLSRTDWPGVLRKAGFTGQPDKQLADAPVPADALKDLAQLDIIDQFAALRLTHAAIHSTGSSPQRLAVLVEGYANLARLTDALWCADSEAFAARSILYAERMVALYPDSPFALWHRAYAYALAGCDRYALDDLTAAQALIKNGQNRDPKSLAEPGWTPLISAFCRGDVGELSNGLSNAQTAPLASLLCFFSVDCSDSASIKVGYAQAALQVNPHCCRLFDALNSAGSLGIKANSSLQSFFTFSQDIQGLRQWRDLPVAAATDLKKPRDPKDPYLPDADAAQALVHSTDTGEPSYPALGRLMQEVIFVNVYNRAFFLAYDIAVDASSFIDAAMPLVQGHPYAALLKTMVGDRYSQARFAPLAQLQIVDATPIMMAAIEQYAHVKTAKANPVIEAWQIFHDNHDTTAQAMEVELMRIVKADNPARAGIARNLLSISSYDVIARGTLIVHDFASVQSQAPMWLQQSGDNPLLLDALAVHYADAHQYDQAISYLHRYLKVAPDLSRFVRLGALYLQKKDEAGWLNTMQQALAANLPGLGPATINVAIANHYMDAGRFKDAEPYADVAVDSYSAWAMECEIRCDEGLGKWDDASQWVQKLAERYGATVPWYEWCQRTGHGDLQKATDAARKYVATLSPASGREAMANAFVFYYLQGDQDKSIKCLHAIFDSTGDPWAGMNLAVMLDRQGHRADAEKALEKVVQLGPMDQTNGGVRMQMISVAGLMLNCLKTADAGGAVAKLDLNAVRAASKDASPRDQAHINFFTAKFLQANHQQLDQVQPLLKAAAKAAQLSDSGVLAVVELRRQKH